MPPRKISNYLLLTRNGRSNMKYSSRSRSGHERRPPATVFHRLRDFFESNVLAWFIHTWQIKRRCPYPTSAAGSIHNLPAQPRPPAHPGTPAQPRPICIAVAADWATATPQSVFVGEKIAELHPDYTIHLGDTYYSGTASEHADNFGQRPGDQSDAWPMGRLGTFALTGNHEMYSSGEAYLQMIGAPARGFGKRLPDDQYTGQPVPFCCLRSDHWLILCLDTGYDSLDQQWYKRFFDTKPANLKLKFPDLLMNWLTNEVGLTPNPPDPANPPDPGATQPAAIQPGILVLTHHQYITAFNGEDEFQEPAHQLQSLLPPGREVIWINGHEHRFAIYDKYRQSPDHITAYVRCIGNGGMPDEHTKDRYPIPSKIRSRGLLVYDNRVADTFKLDFGKTLPVGYNGYVQLLIDGDQLQITYYAAYSNGDPQPLPYNEKTITETWQADNKTGAITRLEMIDHTAAAGTTQLTYPNRHP